MLVLLFFQRRMFWQKLVVYEPTTPNNWERFKMELKVELDAMTYIILNGLTSILWHF